MRSYCSPVLKHCFIYINKLLYLNIRKVNYGTTNDLVICIIYCAFCFFPKYKTYLWPCFSYNLYNNELRYNCKSPVCGHIVTLTFGYSIKY